MPLKDFIEEYEVTCYRCEKDRRPTGATLPKQRLAMKDSETSATNSGISVRAFCKTGCNRILERFLRTNDPWKT
jgi:hypothetical protein